MSVTAAADPAGAVAGPATVAAAVGAAGTVAVDTPTATTRQVSTAARRVRTNGRCMAQSYGIRMEDGTIQAWRIAAMARTGQDCAHA
jgi:hypothetical protein